MKKIVVMLLIVLATSFIATAQVPKPPTGENNDTKGRRGAVVRTIAVNSGPIGTATTLLLSLGVGAIAYKVRKSNSNRK